MCQGGSDWFDGDPGVPIERIKSVLTDYQVKTVNHIWVKTRQPLAGGISLIVGARPLGRAGLKPRRYYRGKWRCHSGRR